MDFFFSFFFYEKCLLNKMRPPMKDPMAKRVQDTTPWLMTYYKRSLHQSLGNVLFSYTDKPDTLLYLNLLYTSTKSFTFIFFIWYYPTGTPWHTPIWTWHTFHTQNMACTPLFNLLVVWCTCSCGLSILILPNLCNFWTANKVKEQQTFSYINCYIKCLTYMQTPRSGVPGKSRIGQIVIID